jgi:UDP-glucose 4-epimerase
MKIVVTGALGHIGSKLIRALPALFPGREVVMIDNLSTQRFCSLFDLPETGMYRFSAADILTHDLSTIIAPSDIVVHLAAITDAASSFYNEGQVEKVNLDGTKIVANVCAKKNAKLIFLSTTSVYGTQNDVVDENCSEAELSPQSPYARSKLEAEKYLSWLNNNKGLNYIVCRFGTIFGVSAGMRFHTAVNKFAWQAVMGQPITVWRFALHQRRPYLDLADAIEALKFIIEREMFDGNIYNVLTTNATVSDIIDIIRLFKPNISIKYVDEQIMNQLSYTVSCDKFKGKGFVAKGDLTVGIKETIEILKNANE